MTDIVEQYIPLPYLHPTCLFCIIPLERQRSDS